MFEFFMNTKIVFGSGERRRITEILQQEKWSKIGVVVDHNIQHLPLIKDLLARLEQAADLVKIGSCPLSEPTYDALEEARVTFSDPSLEVIIGIGGGSALDMAKAMAVLVKNKKTAISYRGFDMMTEPVLPIIAIPSTAGTGSEVTPNASFIDSHAKKKLGINGEAVRPRYAILDSELTISCPKDPTISAGVDSIVHAVEAYVAKKTTPMARFFAKEGFTKVFNALPLLMDDLENNALRDQVMYGAFLSGVALMHSGTGPAAAMSYPIGVHHKVPHGLGGGIFLPYVMAYNIDKGYHDYLDLFMHQVDNQVRNTVDALQKIQEVWDILGIPKNLSFCGFQKSGMDTFIQETMELKGALDQNPIPFGREEVRRIIEQLI